MKHSAHRIPQPEFNEAIKIEVYLNEEQKYIWNKMIRIEKIKKDFDTQKSLLLRKTTIRLN